jgi:NADPH:quinone reductase-like Zn-dependent oxidoreductase
LSEVLLTCRQTIDYQKNAPLPTYLAQTHGEEQFDFIFDCVGDQELFGQSSPYLKPDGKFICLSGGKSQGLIPYVKSCLPAFLGGTPRKFTILGLSPSGDLMRQIVKSYEEGKIKTVPIDSEYSMEDVLDVSLLPFGTSLSSLTF